MDSLNQVEVVLEPPRSRLDPPRHRLELKNRGHLQNIREGPYIVHNLLVTHTTFLKRTNEDQQPQVYRIFPFGGTHSTPGDVVGLVFWYILLVYNIVTIPVACYCETAQVNIVNAAILALLCMYHLTAVYVIFRNRGKLKQMWFTAQTSAEKYNGLENTFVDVGLSDTKDLHLVGTHQRQKIIQKLCNKTDKRMVLMLCTASYWKTTIVDPVICLSVLAVISFVSIFVQIETLRLDYHSS